MAVRQLTWFCLICPTASYPIRCLRPALLDIKRLSEPSTTYQIQWSSIARVELFEQMALAEAASLTKQRKSLEAFRSLEFLHKHYPDLPGLDKVGQQFVYRESLAEFANKKYEQSLAILLTLHDLNPDHRSLPSAVVSVSDRIINEHLKSRDFAAARSVLDSLQQSFTDIRLTNIAKWEERFEKGAATQLERGRQAIAKEDFDQARTALRRAIDILPSISGADELLAEINRRSPQTIIGVSQLVTDNAATHDLSWHQARVRPLVNPPLVEMVDFGSEGGIYRSPWAKLQPDDTGLRLDVSISAAGKQIGLNPEQLALSILSLADPTSSNFAVDFAAIFNGISLTSATQAGVHWKRPHVRPEAILRLALSEVNANSSQTSVFQANYDPDVPRDMRYDLEVATATGSTTRRIIERVFESDEKAVSALQSGSIEAIDRLAPWHADLLENDQRVVVQSYRLPTVHVLQFNYEKQLLKSREFRRAICYGIDRQRILDDVLLGGENRTGYRTLSGPLPAGSSYTDPVGYAYNQQLEPRPYEPRLAAVLATVARNALAKLEKTRAEQDPNYQPPPESGSQTLRLAYPPDSLARTCCESIVQQLTAVGIPIELVELPATSTAMPEDYDLLYSRLAFREPLVDARRLLGPLGTAGTCSPSMNLALQSLDNSSNWNQARKRLYEIHQVAFNDLPVIPLWQTVDKFAYRRGLPGISKSPVSLYQNVADWQLGQSAGGRQE